MNANYENIFDDDFDEDDEGTVVNPEDVEDMINTDDDHVEEEEEVNPNLPPDFFKKKGDESDDDDEEVKVTFETEEERDIIEDLLKEKNIDPEAIKFEDEDGNIVDKSFNELTYEEQLELLKFTESEEIEEDESEKVTEDEKALVKYLRDQNKSVNDLLDEREAAIRSEYEKESPVSIDSYSDEELYVYDVATRFPDLTEEELEVKLELAMNNKELFEKEAKMLRTAYTQAELSDRERTESERKAETTKVETEKRTRFEEVLKDANSFADDVLIEDDDKQELVRYAFSKDPDGKTELDKDLQDEEKLFQIAFISKFGETAINMIKGKYEARLKDIDAIKEEAYNKGKEEAINGLPKKPKTIYRPKTKKNQKGSPLERKFTPTEQTITNGRLNQIHDLYD